MPTRSIVTSTARCQAASSSTSAFAQSSSCLVSAGLSREAYPDNQIGSSGIIFAFATPALQPLSAALEAEQAKEVATKTKTRIRTSRNLISYSLQDTKRTKNHSRLA